MERKNGFTLIELLAVIVVLSIILVIATSSVIKNINDSRAKAKYIAAKEIVQIAEAYFAVNGDKTSATISDLSEYLEKDATNPETGKNDLLTQGSNQVVCKNENYSSENQNKYEVNYNGYEFDGYWYGLDGNCK